jgi:hypothetical protein
LALSLTYGARQKDANDEFVFDIGQEHKQDFVSDSIPLVDRSILLNHRKETQSSTQRFRD